jgi:hypothetical protein
MLLDKIIIARNISINSLGGGGVIACFAIQIVLVTVALILGGESNFFVNVTTNIVYLNGIKGIDTFEPIAVEFKHLYVKGGIVGKGVLYLIFLDIPIHGSGDIAKLIQDTASAPHATHVDIPLVCVVSCGEKHGIVPDLLNNIVLLYQNFGGICVKNHIADVIAKGFFQTGGFCVKN